MPQEIDFTEAKKQPCCPFCESPLTHIEFTRQKLSFGFMRGFTWVVLLQCGNCAKVLGTQTWD
jgi:hypothetical protein